MYFDAPELPQRVGDPADQLAAVVPVRSVRVAVAVRIAPDAAAGRQGRVRDAPAALEPKAELGAHLDLRPQAEIEIEQRMGRRIDLRGLDEGLVDARMRRRPAEADQAERRDAGVAGRLVAKEIDVVVVEV